ncbi:DUF4040 domain-containing protein [Candidatus Synechococcus calcipolaris G9]|uniref:DUF4040 domain-containing protein n=1 Tax=Candidatus Synechococcus calcipolaris G9 TaxID=1497997 RepID=A0ABT6EYN7_9SYNE|nr:DUF4040 domain-containing protein [Candidatus Synechococcus calcipolaris]MDG2990517.1 DUF4040 domain-containing protein [Candidatus Synechococcus calcipolaris G9]
MDNYVYGITALLPLTAAMVVFQGNPYHALVIRGILGAVAALVYAVFGAADVALTEALVGTMLTVTLSAVAVRSSLVMRLGVLKDEMESAPIQAPSLPEPLEPVNPLSVALEPSSEPSVPDPFHQLLQEFRRIANKHYLRLEVIPYPDIHTLSQGLVNGDVHTICAHREQPTPLSENLSSSPDFFLENKDGRKPYDTVTRIHRLYQILHRELASPMTSLIYTPVKGVGEPSPDEHGD